MYKDLKIRVISDRDFQIPDGKDSTIPNTKLYYWKLPCIESYLFVYHCIKNRDKDPLAFFRDEKTQWILSTKYMNGFVTKNKSSINSEDLTIDNCHPLHKTMFETWSNAIHAASKNPPTDQNIFDVAKVLHGHTWVEIINRTTTPQLINQLDEDIDTFCPDLRNMLNTLLE